MSNIHTSPVRPSIRRPKRLITFGDSHSLWSFAACRPAKFLWIGAKTMHAASRDGIDSLLPKRYRPRASDLLLISFGEIDCRCHISKQSRKSGRSLKAEVDALCDRYEQAIAKFNAGFPGKIALCCIVPPAREEKPGDQQYGSHEEFRAAQIEIRSYMNERLSKIPETLFFDFRVETTASDGCIKQELGDDLCHINPFYIGDIIVNKIQKDNYYPFVTYKKPPDDFKNLKYSKIEYIAKRLRVIERPIKFMPRPVRYKIKRFFGFAERPHMSRDIDRGVVGRE